MNFVVEILDFVYEIRPTRISYRRIEIRLDEILGDEFRLPAIRIRIWISYTKLWLGAILNRIGADGRASAPGNCNFARFCKRNGRFSPKGGAGLRIAISQGFISEMERFLILADPPGHSNFARFYKRNGRLRIWASNAPENAISQGFISEMGGFLRWALQPPRLQIRKVL